MKSVSATFEFRAEPGFYDKFRKFLMVDVIKEACGRLGWHAKALDDLPPDEVLPFATEITESDPDEIGPAMRLADYFDERRDDRGELIRAQVESRNAVQLMVRAEFLRMRLGVDRIEDLDAEIDRMCYKHLITLDMMRALFDEFQSVEQADCFAHLADCGFGGQVIALSRAMNRLGLRFVKTHEPGQ